VVKEPSPTPRSLRAALIRDEPVDASLFVMHIRQAKWGASSEANTQPFYRSWGGRDWLMAHSGSMRDRLEVTPGAQFQPVGSSDTEIIFCEFLSRMARHGFRRLADVDLATIQRWFAAQNTHGSMTTVLTDGLDLLVYADADAEGEVFLWHILPPYNVLSVADAELEVDLTKRGAKSCKGIVVASNPMEPTSDCAPRWVPVSPGSLVALRQGAIWNEFHPSGDQISVPIDLEPIPARPRNVVIPVAATPRRLSVFHRTVYRYQTPVERSSHMLRLTPIHDRLQRLISSEINLSVEGESTEFEDVFGNFARRVVLEQPYTELTLEARSEVQMLDFDPFRFRARHVRSSIPLVWLPWQRIMLEPFLLPAELPDTQLEELADYAMSFVERNDFDLVDTLLDLNMTIFMEYEYKQGATTIFTTPFEVYEGRQGVCQDFANLFICLSRLLGVPARYVCGYLFTGPSSPNQTMADASHAWVQVYLPGIGWKGLDPTNGVITQTDHIKVAVGRNYLDATPTAGTIFVGGGPEQLEVEVRVDFID
jgi:transglutaminase-like putative cysteine protease/predicted glutamine amidotransferase